MNKEEALNVIKQACAGVTANLDTHSTIQQAIKKIEELLADEDLESKPA
jgi:hypothetical protein